MAESHTAGASGRRSTHGPTRPSRASIHGRRRELDAIDRAIESVGAGLGGVTVFVGAAGQGKSTLLAELAARAEHAGVDVHASAATLLEGHRPFGPLVEALACRPWSDHPGRARVGRLVSGAANPDPTDAPPEMSDGLDQDLAVGAFAIQDGIVDLIEELASRCATALVIDDVQWADAATVTTLAALARRAPRAGVLLAIACRPEPRSTELAHALTAMSRGAEVMTLGALADDDVLAMATTLLGARPGPRLTRHLRAAAGHPYAVRSLLDDLAERGVLDETAEGATPSIELRPGTAHDVWDVAFGRRLDALSPVANEIVQHAAVLARSVTAEEIAALTSSPVASVVAEIRALTASGLLVPQGDRFGFGHDLQREVAYRRIPEGLRHAMHRLVADRLTEAGEDPEVIAHHLAIAARPGEAAAIERIRVASHGIAPRDPVTALRLLDRADQLELRTAEHPAGDVDADRLATRIDLLRQARRPREAVSVATDALATVRDPDARARLELALANAHLELGDYTEGTAALQRAAAGGALSPRVGARVHAELANLKLWGNAGAALERDDIEIAEQLARDAGADDTLAQVFMVRSAISWWSSDLARSMREAVTGAEIARRLPADERPALDLYLGMAHMHHEELEEASAVIRRGLREVERAGNLWSATRHLGALVVTRYLEGSWDDATADAEAIVRSNEVLDGQSQGVVSRAIPALIAFHRGDDATADACEREARRLLEQPGAEQTGNLFLGILEGWRLVAADQVEAAADHFSGLHELLAILGPGTTWWVVTDAVRTAVAAGRTATAGLLAEQTRVLAARAGTPHAAMVAEHCEALVDGSADRLLVSATAQARRQGKLEAALAAEDAARALRVARRTTEADAIAEQARLLFEKLGADRHLRRLDPPGRSASVRRRGRPGFGWESLSPAEAAVLHLVAAGASNPAIADGLVISKRTVESHLSAMYRKLGVPNRVALATEALRRGH